MRYIIIVILLFVSIVAPAQKRSKKSSAQPRQLIVEQVKSMPIDTITKDSVTKIIIFSNNTFKYYYPEMRKYDNLSVYRHNWDTTQIFAYRNVELVDLPAIVDLKLAESMEDYCSPIKGVVLSKYGPRGRRNHNGVDIPLKVGEPILAAFDGKVRYAKYNSGGFGYLVIVRHKNGLETYNAHLSRMNVKADDYVKAGQVIGFGGKTGRAYGPHLHFEVRYCDQTFDPEFIFDFTNGEIKYMTFALEKKYFNIRSRASEILEDIDDEILVEDILSAADDSTGVRVIQNKTPVKNSATSGTIIHTVVNGDMLSKLAVKYGVTVDQICRLNKITRTTTLQLKQKLRIK